MNLGIEYIIRKGIANTILKPPFSIFLVNSDYDKVVVSIHEDSTHYIGKYWEIGKCSAWQALPSMYEFSVNDFCEIKKNLKNHHLLSYEANSFANCLNSWRTPMPDGNYFNCVDKFIFSHKHYRKRVLWLWKAFIQTYKIIFSNTINDELLLSEYSLMCLNSNNLKQEYLKYWKYWCLWKKHFILPAGELLFISSPK